MPQILRVRTRFTYGIGSPGLMTTYFQGPDGDSTTNSAQNAVNRVRDALNTSPGLFAAGQLWDVLGDVDAMEDTTGVVTQRVAVDHALGAGTDPNGLGPLPAGLLLQAHTNTFIAGRRLVGRTYLVPVGQVAMRAGRPPQAVKDLVTAIGTAMMNEGITQVRPVVWSRPRPATPVGPGRPAGQARAARAGSSSVIASYTCGPDYVVMTSRRD